MGAFDDLIPQEQSSGGAFDDLIPPDKSEEEVDVLSTINQFARSAPGIGAALSAGQAVFGEEKVEGVQRAMADGALLGFGDESEAVLEALFTDKT